MDLCKRASVRLLQPAAEDRSRDLASESIIGCRDRRLKILLGGSEGTSEAGGSTFGGRRDRRRVPGSVRGRRALVGPERFAILRVPSRRSVMCSVTRKEPMSVETKEANQKIERAAQILARVSAEVGRA